MALAGVTHDNEDMFGSVVVIMLTTLVVVALAGGVLASLALSRRGAQSWQSLWKDQSRRWADPARTDEDADIDPQRVSLDTMLRSNGRDGSAYVDATDLPGYERLEDAAVRVEEAATRMEAASRRGRVRKMQLTH